MRRTKRIKRKHNSKRVFREKQDGHHVHVYIQANAPLSSVRTIAITTMTRADSVQRVLVQHCTKEVPLERNIARGTVTAAVTVPVREDISHVRIKKVAISPDRVAISLARKVVTSPDREDTSHARIRKVAISPDRVATSLARDKAAISHARVDTSRARDKAVISNARVDTSHARVVISSVLMVSPMRPTRKDHISGLPITIRMQSTA